MVVISPRRHSFLRDLSLKSSILTKLLNPNSPSQVEQHRACNRLMPENEILNLLVQICMGLKHMHDRHPSNGRILTLILT